MSDGNFNRSLLPHTPYHSGLQAGKAIMHMQAIKAFKAYLTTCNPSLTDKEIDQEVMKLKKLLFPQK